MGKPTDPQADQITNGPESVYTDGAYNPDAVLAYLVNQGVPVEQAKTLSASLRRGAPDDLGIQGSAAAQVADREVGRLKAVTRYLDLEKKAVSGAKLPPADEAFVAAVRNRHRELIQQRAIMAQAQQQDNDRARQQLQAGERSKMAALQGQQLERVGGREQNRLQNMEAYAQDPSARALSPTGDHASYIPEGKAGGQPVNPREAAMMQQLFQQKQMRQATTAAAIAQQFGVPPDAAAQLAAGLHGMQPSQPSQPQQPQQPAPNDNDTDDGTLYRTPSVGGVTFSF